MDMTIYAVESSFWWKLLLLIVIVWLLFFSFGVIMRKILSVPKRKKFSYNYVNDRHKKVDWTIRTIFIFAMIIGAFINVSRDPLAPILFLEPYFLLIVLIIISEIFTAYMEWKHAENRNAYLLTISELVFMVIVFLFVYVTNFFDF